MTISQAPGIKLNSIINPEGLSLSQDLKEEGLFIIHNPQQAVLGRCKLASNCQTQVEFYEGKGGLTAILTSPKGLKYFALPGSSLQLGGLVLELPGAPIQPQVRNKSVTPTASQLQTVTHQAMILGAGLATRFEPVSGDNTQYAKPSVPLVGQQSVIECIAQVLKRSGLTALLVNTFYKPESLKAGLSKVPDVTVSYIDEAQPSGTAGGLRKILSEKGYEGYLDLNKPLVVVQGDAVTDVDFSSLIDAHMRHKAAITIGCQVVTDEQVDKVGIVETDRSDTDGHSGSIVGFKEKPSLAAAGPHRLGSTGFYIFAPEAYSIVVNAYENKLAQTRAQASTLKQQVPEEVLLDFANDIFPAALAQIQAGQVKNNITGEPMTFWAQVVEGYWSDIGNPTQYIQTVREIYEQQVNIPLPENQELFYEHGVIYWPGAKEKATQENAVLSGNVIVALPFH